MINIILLNSTIIFSNAKLDLGLMTRYANIYWTSDSKKAFFWKYYASPYITLLCSKGYNYILASRLCLSIINGERKTIFLAPLENGESLVNFLPSMTRHLIVYLCVARTILFRCKVINEITKHYGNITHYSVSFLLVI